MKQVTIELTPLFIIDVFSITTSVMLGFLFLTITSENKKANTYLALFLWALSLEILDSFQEGIHNFYIAIIPTVFLTIPLLFLYVDCTLNRKQNYLILLILLPWTLLLIFDLNIEALKIIEYIFNITILILVLRRIKDIQVKVENYYSEIENKTLQWIKTIVYIYLFFHAFWILEDIIDLTDQSITLYFAAISSILTFFMIYWIAYKGFSQIDIFKENLFSNVIVQKLNTQENDTQKQFDRLVYQIEDEKIYLDQNLNLRLLSERVGVKEKELSKLINYHTENNFYYFINTFRVNAFKILLSSEKANQLSLLGLANEAGFTSKSTFYTAFKKLEGVTPKQYQKQIKESE